MGGKRIERELNHTYLILGERKNEDYRLRMLQENSIPGILPINKRFVNGVLEDYIDITGLRSFEDMFFAGVVFRNDIRMLYEAIHHIAEVAAEFLLDEEIIFLRPSNIFIDLTDNEYRFVCYPGLNEGDMRDNGIKELLMFLMERVDSSDDAIVQNIFTAFNYADSGCISFSDLYSMSSTIFEETRDEIENEIADEIHMQQTEICEKTQSGYYIPSIAELVGIALFGIGSILIGYDIYLGMLLN